MTEAASGALSLPLASDQCPHPAPWLPSERRPAVKAGSCKLEQGNGGAGVPPAHCPRYLPAQSVVSPCTCCSCASLAPGCTCASQCNRAARSPMGSLPLAPSSNPAKKLTAIALSYLLLRRSSNTSNAGLAWRRAGVMGLLWSESVCRAPQSRSTCMHARPGRFP